MLLTVAAIVCAFINFIQQNKFRLPDDGVIWGERGAAVQALHVASGSPAEKAGLRAGDVVLKINGVSITKATDVSRVLVRLGAWNKARYAARRSGVDFETTLIIGNAGRDYPVLYYNYFLGLAYLAIGLFVLFRRGNAPMSLHFYMLCLASFVFATFHYTGKLNNFDKLMYWGNVVAGLLAPAILLHFCLVFPESRSWFRQWWRAALVYVPPAALLSVFFGAASGRLRVAVPPIELKWMLDRVWLAFQRPNTCWAGWS